MMALFERYVEKTNTEQMEDIATTLLELPWFNHVGEKSENTEKKLANITSTFNINSYDVKWIGKEDLADQLDSVNFDESELWNVLKDLPTKYKAELQELGLEETWEILLLEVPEHVYHKAFEKAYESSQDKQTVEYLINNAFYVCVLITLAKLTGDDSFATTLIEFVETGNIVVGFQGNTIILL